MQSFTKESSLVDTSINGFLNPTIVSNFIGKYHPNSHGRQLAALLLNAANANGINAIYFIAHGCCESSWYQDEMAVYKKNYWGYMAYDSNVSAMRKFNSDEEGINFIGQFMKEAYLSPSGFAYKIAQQRGHTPATINGMTGIWWTSKSQADTLLAVMNMFVAFCNTVSVVGSPTVEPVQAYVSPQPQGKFVVQTGPWRSNVIQDIINAHIWTGTWDQNQDKFNALNPITPQGGWKKGDLVNIDQAVNLQQTPAPVAPVQQTSEPAYRKYAVQHNETLIGIYSRYFNGRYLDGNWSKFLEFLATHDAPPRFNKNQPGVIGEGWIFTLPNHF